MDHSKQPTRRTKKILKSLPGFVVVVVVVVVDLIYHSPEVVIPMNVFLRCNSNEGRM